MDQISDAAVVEALRRQLSMAASKQAVAASNLANVNTPGYRAREAEFGDALDQRLAESGRLTATDPGHITSPPTAEPPGTREAEGLPARRDGNTVQLDRELLGMVEAAGEFTRAQTALAAKFRLVRYAINEGR